MNVNEEIAVYKALSKIAGTIFMDANRQLIAVLQNVGGLVGLGAVNGMSLSPQTISNYGLTESEAALLNSLQSAEISAAWKKHVSNVEYGLTFEPKLNIEPSVVSQLTIPGEKISVPKTKAPDQFQPMTNSLGALADWTIEIDIGIIRAEVKF